MVIALAGYIPVGETGIYISSEKNWEITGCIQTDANRRIGTNVNRIIELRKFTIPSEDDVVDLLVEKAYDLKKDPEREVKEGSLESELKKLSEIQENILEEIRNRNEERLLFIRKYTKAPTVKDEKREGTIIARYGILPYQIADQVRENEFMKDELLDDEKLTKLGLGHKWYLNLLLVNGLMPSRKVMRTLIGSGAPSSKFHQVRGENESTKEVMNFMNLLYLSAPTRDKIKEIKDTSESALEDLAKEPISLMIQIEEKKTEGAKKARNKEIEEAKEAKCKEMLTYPTIANMPN